MGRIYKLLVLALLPTSLFANEQFEYRYKDGSFTVAYLTCEVNSEEDKTVTLVNFKYNDKEFPDFKMPDMVEYNGEEYLITVIGERAFENDLGDNFALRNLTLPSGIVEIGDYAFYEMSNIETIILPSALETIGDYAFCHCDELKQILLPESLLNIGEYAFRSCGELSEITIPDSVSYISYGIFMFCHQLGKAYLGNDVHVIEEGAFGQCPLLSELYIKTIIPPTVTSKITDVDNITVYVPKGTETDYQVEWQNVFKNAQYVGYYDAEGSGETAGIESVDNSELQVTVTGNTIFVRNIDGNLQIYSVAGVKAAETSDASFSVTLPDGIYILKTPDTVRKVILR